MGLIDNVRNSIFNLIQQTPLKDTPIETLFEPKTKEYQDYKDTRKASLKNIEFYKKYLTEANTIEKKNRWEYTLNEEKKQLSFIRPNSAEDIAYRNEIADSFVANLKSVAGNLNLRFHGTPIYFAEDIIRSGELSSAADRWNGYNKSTDGRGVFSVSDINSIDRTVTFFLGLSEYHHNLPCGCLFVLTPGDQTEYQQRESIMNRLDLKQNPDRLHSIVTTPENIERVQQWMIEAGFDPEKVHTFEEFTEIAREESLKLEQEQKSKESVIKEPEYDEDLKKQLINELEQESLQKEPVQMETVLQAFKEQFQIPKNDPVSICDGYIVINTVQEKEDGSLENLMFPLLKINELDPFDFETGLNHDNMEMFYDIQNEIEQEDVTVSEMEADMELV